jgi:hypothetical protein|tara:strand:- start:5707 stop:6288 length:582 start_codon:yes stop_codon:yes gene_type:complete
MTRSLDSTLESNLTSKQLRIADLIELHLSTAVYFTNAFIDISYDSPTAPDSGANTYLAQGQFLGFGAVNETRDIRVANLAITFTAVDFTTIALVLNNDYIDRRVVLYRALLNDNLAIDTNQVWQYFDGRISDFSIRETDNTAQLTLSVSSQFADYEKTAGRRTNNESQQRFFSTDVGMEFAPQIQTDIKWGRV